MRTTVLVLAAITNLAGCVAQDADDDLDVTSDGKTDSPTTRISLSKDHGKTFTISCSRDCEATLHIQMVDRVLATKLTETPPNEGLYFANSTWEAIVYETPSTIWNNQFGYGYDGKPAQYETCDDLKLPANTRVTVELETYLRTLPSSFQLPDPIEYDVTLSAIAR